MMLRHWIRAETTFQLQVPCRYGRFGKTGRREITSVLFSSPKQTVPAPCYRYSWATQTGVQVSLLGKARTVAAHLVPDRSTCPALGKHSPGTRGCQAPEASDSPAASGGPVPPHGGGPGHGAALTSHRTPRTQVTGRWTGSQGEHLTMSRYRRGPLPGSRSPWGSPMKKGHPLISYHPLK